MLIIGSKGRVLHNNLYFILAIKLLELEYLIGVGLSNLLPHSHKPATYLLLLKKEISSLFARRSCIWMP